MKLFYYLKLFSKIILMHLLYVFVEFYAFLTKRKFSSPKIIGILHLQGLGFGDLIMLSPAIQKIPEIFPQSKIYLITDYEPIVDFSFIEWISPENWRKKKIKADLLISPTLLLRHFFWIFKAKYWAGYFALAKIQSNFGLKSYSFHLKKEHYLWRGIRLIKAFDREKGEELEREARAYKIAYPPLLFKEPSYFKNNLQGRSYLVLAPFSKQLERQWPIANFAKLIEKIFQLRKFEKIVIIGGKSNWEKKKLAELLSHLELKIFPSGFLLEVVGKNSLKETAYLIKNSSLFIGLDSGPSHFAYLTAPRVLAIFITVDPLFVLPLTEKPSTIQCLLPQNCPNFPCYSGIISPPFQQCQKCINLITLEKVSETVENLLRK